MLLIGNAHSLLLWDGAFLKLYTILGMLLLFFRKAKPCPLLIWRDVFQLISTFLLSGDDYISKETMHIVEAAIEMYSSETYLDIVCYRLQNFAGAMIGSIFQGFSVFAMFLLGLHAGKQGLFTNNVANYTIYKG